MRTLSARLTFPETQSSQSRRPLGAEAKVASVFLAGGRSQRHTGVKSQPHCAHTAGTELRGMLRAHNRNNIYHFFKQITSFFFVIYILCVIICTS